MASLLAAMWMTMTPDKDPFGYRHPRVVLMSMGVFLGALQMKSRPAKWLLQWSACTWGIYLLHPLLIKSRGPRVILLAQAF